MGPTILICEDESDIVAALEYNLRREGYEIRSVGTAEAALRELQIGPLPDLLLLDLMLPDLSGTEVCRRIRRDPRLAALPVIMLTARAEEIDRVVGFEVGADDYLTKPFSIRELALRIRAVLRRTGTGDGGAGDTNELGPLLVDLAGHRVWVAGALADLTVLEFKILTVFLQQRGRALTREQLLRETWGPSHHVTLRAVDTHVKRLRQKLGVAGDYIETVRGVGYCMRVSTPEDPP